MPRYRNNIKELYVILIFVRNVVIEGTNLLYKKYLNYIHIN